VDAGGWASILVPSGAVIVSAWITTRKVGKVHDEVRTGNRQTIGTLSSIAHGRDISTDIPEGERSGSDRHYVEMYDQDRSDPQD
jgi:hypothetical protein